jgi:hypothetical protein
VTRSMITNPDRMAFAPGTLQLAPGAISPTIWAANRFQNGRCWCCCRGGCRRRCRCWTLSSALVTPGVIESQFFTALLRQRLTFGRDHRRWLKT